MAQDNTSNERDKPHRKPETIAGPSSDPATNLMIADVVMRSISSAARKSAKKGLTRKRFDNARAQELLARDSIAKTLLLYGASKLAARSLPGAVLVGGAMLAKSTLDRKKARASAKQADRIDHRLEEPQNRTLKHALEDQEK